MTSFNLAVFVVFAIGVVLFGAGSAMLRASDRGGELPQWPKLVDDTLTEAGAALRADMAERLRLIDNAWSRGVLQQAAQEERDPSVLAAIRGER